MVYRYHYFNARSFEYLQEPVEKGVRSKKVARSAGHGRTNTADIYGSANAEQQVIDPPFKEVQANSGI